MPATRRHRLGRSPRERQDAAQMPVQLRRKDFEKGNFTQWLTGVGKKTNYLLQVQPNPIMTANDMWLQVHINRLQNGNGFIYIERDVFGQPGGVVACHLRRV